ncbi:calcium-binding protein [Aureimonas sp. AU12]|uniref:calcium-binding protein n=1 Tax=Aureimonas sp. AU12 TaxID=1638161 RepID=UPI00178CC2B6|nr:calcium-binding protein [Aureimonas sp. AU12]
MGDDQANTLIGTKCADDLSGLGGNDLLVGKRGNDILSGGDGNDTLNGGSGRDQLHGGNGTDTITYENSCAAVEINLATGLARGGEATGDTFTSIENVTGSAYHDRLTGDAGVNVLNGLAGNDTLDGGAGNDRLFGGIGNDRLIGGEGNDQLVGDTGTNDDIGKGGGADTMLGGVGNDTYSVYQSGDIVIENADEGTGDIVLASVDYTLTANVENLTLFNMAVSGTGNELANKITGSSGNNIINGKGGIDDLVGGGGSDTFVFDKADATSRDIVRDFISGDDKVGISVSGFGLKLAAGQALPDDYFFVDTTRPTSADPAQTDHGQFILVRDSASIVSLYFDADGGLAANNPVLVANFIGGTAPTAADFALVA